MRAPLRWIVVAWVVYLAAWVLPVHEDGVELPEGVPGWQAFRIAASPVWPLEGISFERWSEAILSALSAGTNLVMLASVWTVLRRSRRSLRMVGWASLVAFVIDSQWWVLEPKEISNLRIGYYLWWLAFLLLGVSALKLTKEKGGARPTNLAPA